VTPDEKGQAARILAGFWPSPSATTEELLALNRVFEDPSTFGDFERAAEMLALQGRKFRPNPSEIMATMRSVRHHRLSDEAWSKGLPEAPPCSNPFPYFEQCREALEAAKAKVAAEAAEKAAAKAAAKKANKAA
jgi:hypothetical protein